MPTGTYEKGSSPRPALQKGVGPGDEARPIMKTKRCKVAAMQLRLCT